MTSDRTWRRFTAAVAVAAGVALAVGLALSYGSAYRAAFNAGYDTTWLTMDSRHVRPAHLYPLTLDVPALVGYAGMIALAGRRSASLARGVLVACGGAAIALQVMDGAGWITEHTLIKAVIHGWPPLLAFITAHLFVKIIQSLGYLQPPVLEQQRPSWIARTWQWATRLWADIRAAKKDPTPDANYMDGEPDSEADKKADIQPDGEADKKPAKPQVNDGIDEAALARKHGMKAGRQLTAVLRQEVTQKEAAKRLGVSERTMSRWVAAEKVDEPEAVAQ